MKSILLTAALPLALAAATAQAAPAAPADFPPAAGLQRLLTAGRDGVLVHRAAGARLHRAGDDGRALPDHRGQPATATQADATQTLAIKLGDAPCAADPAAPLPTRRACGSAAWSAC